MEQEEKKKRKKYRRRRQSKSTSSFPPDLTSEILSRLPARSVVRFRCVSKLWSSIMADPYFINSFETQSLRRPSLLLCFRIYENMFFFSVPQHTRISNRSYSSSQPIDRCHMRFPKNYSRFPHTESVHGLICFQEYGKPVVWNPSKRQFLTLPKPREWEKITVFLGYDPNDGKHKVVCIPFYKDCDVCRVLTLGSPQESWRTVRTNHKHRSYMHTSGRYVKGVIYYLAYSSHTLDLVLMSFDVRSEKFDMRALPSDIRNSKLINYGGRLACGDRNNSKRLWILEDAEKDKWSSQDILGHFETYFSLKGITNAGELIYVPNRFDKSFYILFFDPLRNSSRRFELNSLTDDKPGLGRMYTRLHAFPNHIESQISL